MSLSLPIFLLIIVLYTGVAVWLSRRSITMPMFFLAVGALSGAGILNLATYDLESETIKLLVEVTLALLLFADSSSLSLHRLRHDAGLPARLILIALPLVILLGGMVAYALFPHEGLGFALLIGAILSPTDAALGLPIFTNPRVPARIRNALNVESGLNDGVATPFVTLFAALAIAEQTHNLANWAAAALIEIAIAVAVGVAVGLAGGFLLAAALRSSLTSRATEQIGVLALALAAYFGSVAFGGNGFIAAFVGGLFFGFASRKRQHEVIEFTEASGVVLSLFVWTIFGGIIVVPLFANFNPLALLYGLLSLTLIRFLPVAVALIGLRFRPDTRALMGWLGPRGLASVVFTIIAYESFIETGRPHEILFTLAGWTILLSVVLHGFSAMPLAEWYARRLESAPPDLPEFKDIPEQQVSPTRLSVLHRPPQPLP